MSWMRPLGATGLEVSALCLGGGPLGSMPQLFGQETPAERGIRTVLAALDSPIRFIDTSNGYSDGESERRIGEALRRVGGVPAGVVVETKTDPRGPDYSGDRVRRSVEESMERLGLDRLPLVPGWDVAGIVVFLSARARRSIPAASSMRIAPATSAT